MSWLQNEWDAWSEGFKAGFRVFRQYKRVLLFSVLSMLTGILFPALVASRTIPSNVATVPLAFLAYLFIWFNAAHTGFRSAAALYGYPVKSFFPDEGEEKRRKLLPGRTVTNCAFSFALSVYGFALAYVFLSNVRPNSFNVGRLGIFSGTYFSLTTIATVGFGDIVPITTVSRLLVMCEILTGMLYVIFVFSIIASFVREKTPLGN